MHSIKPDYFFKYDHSDKANCMRAILKSYAKSGKSSRMYQFEKENRGYSHGLIVKVFGILREEGFIEVEETEMWRTNKPSHKYRITFKGLSLIFWEMGEEKWSFKMKFARKHKAFLPLIFGKWDHFKEEGVIKIAEKHLDKVFTANLTRDEIYRGFFLTTPLDDLEVFNKWMDALRDDPDIREWMTPRVKFMLKGIEAERAKLCTMLEYLEKTT